MSDANFEMPRIVGREEWRSERKRLLEREKQFTRERDALNAERRRLPMVRIDKDYAFDGPQGRATLADLFDGRTQLIVYHFMLDPDHEAGCPGCSHVADNIPHLAHLHARGTTLALVSRAPLAKIECFRERMGWTAPWYSSFGSEFNYDFHVTLDDGKGLTEWNFQDTAKLRAEGRMPAKGELPGVSVFLRDGSRIFHTYSAYARGLDILLNTYHYLDLTPFGRGEGWDGMPDVGGKGLGWLRHHDRY